MKYQAPYGSVDPNAPYVDKDVPGAVAGSKVPAPAIEDPQRELAGLITKSGFTPTDLDLTQIAVAIRSQRLNYATAGGAANAITVTLDPALAAYTPGLPLRVRIATTNTGSVTLNAGPGVKQVRTLIGDQLLAGDLVAGAIVDFVYDSVLDVWVCPSVAKGIGPYTLGPSYQITASGTWNRPAGCRAIKIVGLGGGGAGGGAQSSAAGTMSNGAGGGGGGLTKKLIINPLASYAVTVGAAGTSVAGAAGNNGGTASWGSVCSATGGTGGQTLVSGTAQNAASCGTGGTGVGGDMNGEGDPGSRSVRFSGSNGFGGNGGSTMYGGGGLGRGETGAGLGAGGSGAGGGGALENTGSAARGGGMGSTGVWEVEEYY